MGDVMLGRGIATTIRQHGPALIPDEVVGLLNGDLTLGNLEGPLAESARPRSGLPSLTSPPALSPVLRRAGFDALSLANNHALDAGARGIDSTLHMLDRLSIEPLGIANSPDRAGGSAGPTALLAFVEPGLGGTSDAVDVLVLGEAALDAVSTARRQSEHVVVLVHWGDEYAERPNARQRAWARRLSAAGADLIVGSHPHVLQPVEVVHTGKRSTFVSYSLGNFIFDQTERPDTRTGVVLRVLLDRSGVAGAWAAPTTFSGGRVRALAPGSREHANAMKRLGVP